MYLLYIHWHLRPYFKSNTNLTCGLSMLLVGMGIHVLKYFPLLPVYYKVV